jgi:hypothetical protein
VRQPDSFAQNGACGSLSTFECEEFKNTMGRGLSNVLVASRLSNKNATVAFASHKNGSVRAGHGLGRSYDLGSKLPSQDLFNWLGRFGI